MDPTSGDWEGPKCAEGAEEEDLGLSFEGQVASAGVSCTQLEKGKRVLVDRVGRC